MTLRGTVHAFARALGVWWWESAHRLSAGLALRPDGSSLVWFHERDQVGTVVDDLTAALLLLGHARGLRVDIGGKCSTCDGTARENMGTVRLEDGPRLADLFAAGWALDNDDDGPGHWFGPCSACTVDGKPTGRHTIPWAQALLDAMDKPPCCRGLPLQDIECGCEGRYGIDGDEVMRTALVVLADKMQAAGDPLGLWIAAWLAGPEHIAHHEPAMMVALAP